MYRRNWHFALGFAGVSAGDNALDPGEVDFDFTSDTTEPEGCWDD
jgi:hypothetical protein